MTQDIIQHFAQFGKSDTWFNLATKFDILPNGTREQRADKVRKLFNRFVNTKQFVIKEKQVVSKIDKSDYEEFLEFKKSKRSKQTITPYNKGNSDNVLVVGDLHLPFVKKGYLEFCREQQERFNCGTVIFIGDLLDNHAQSFHDSDADGLSAKDELLLAIDQLKDWYSVFPLATVCLGNHDRIIARKLFSVGVSQRWMRPLGDVLETPNWQYVEQIVHNNTLYVHGEGGTAKNKAKQEMCSVVQGHLHSEGYIEFMNGGRNFAMQVGCGIDFDTYAFAYAQRGKRPIISCGVVLNSSPVLIPFLD